MSDEPDRPRVVTAPLAAAPAVVPEPPAPPTASPRTAPLNPRATQMSATAVPATLESPPDPTATLPAGTDDLAATLANANGPNGAPDEINAATIARADTTREDAAREAPLADAGPQAPARRVGPATLMSPAVIAPLTGESAPPLAPENAVIDVGAPAHAFVPYGSGAPPGIGGPHGMANHGSAGGSGAGTGRSTSTTFLVLVVGGIVAAVAVLVVVVLVVVLVARRRAAAADARGTRQPSTVAPELPESPRMGGTKARIAVTNPGTLDAEAVRVAVTGVLPRIDACFAATELEAPNHESAAYDLDVAASGEVRRAEPATAVGRTVKLDACVVQNLRAIRMPRSTKASGVKLIFSAPIEPR